MTDRRTQPPSAVVTGAASGIGLAIAHELRARGWRVGGLDLAEANQCDAWERVDVSDAAAVHAAVQRLGDRLGPVTGAVSAAGYYEMVPVAEITEVQWRRMLRVHLGGLRNLATAVLRQLGPDGELALVAVSSELAVGGGDHDAHYAAAKGAVLGVVRSLAAELAPRGIRVNAVAPGPTDTPLLPADSPWREPAYLQTLPSRRLVTPEEVALCTAFLLDEATFCTGAVLDVNAGAVI
jgi:NAD(P)-dependent dehydrogenase (short-subunit alcohol dehydrogenase family)